MESVEKWYQQSRVLEIRNGKQSGLQDIVKTTTTNVICSRKKLIREEHMDKLAGDNEGDVSLGA